MEEYKYLCVFDMDGTLLDNNHEIPKTNIVAINELQKMNVGITLATGRTELTTRRYVRELKIRLPIIANNGSLIMDIINKKPIYENIFSINALEEFIKYSINNKKDYFLYTIDKIFYSPYSRKIEVMKKYNLMSSPDEQVDLILLPEDINEVFNTIKNADSKIDVFKALLSFQNENDEIFCKNIKGVESVMSQPDALDVIPYRTSKGEAVKYLSEKLGVRRENIFAFGDQYNDITMLEYAGHSIAPSSAVTSVKRIVNYITTSNDEAGVADAIYKYVIPRIK